MILDNFGTHMQQYILLIFEIGLIAISFRFLGKFVLDFLSFDLKPNYFRNFIFQITGSTVFVVANAIYFTNGKTVMMAFTIIPIFTIFVRKIRPRFLRTFDFRSYFYIDPRVLLNLLLLLALTLALKLYFYSFNGNSSEIPHTDYGFYAKITNYLLNFHIENTSLEYIYPDKFGVQPYHYYELWLNLGFSNLFASSHFYNYTMITSSYGLWVLCIGFLAIIETFNNRVSAIYSVVALISTFFIGFSPDIYQQFKFMQVVDVFTTNAWNYQKLFPIYWFLIAAAISWRYKIRMYSLIFLLCLPIIFITTAPSILLSISMYLLFLKLTKFDSAHELAKAFSLTCMIFAYIGIFYIAGNVGGDGYDIKSSLLKIGNFSHFRTAINVIAGTTIQVIILLSPYILVAVINLRHALLRRDFLSNIIIPALIYGVGLFSWSVLNSAQHSVQVFSNISIPVINIGIFYTFLFVIYRIERSKVRTISILALALLLMFGVYQTFNKIFKEQSSINKVFTDQVQISKLTNKVGVYFDTLSGVNPTFHTPTVAYHLLYDVKGVDVISLSTLSSALDPNNRYYQSNRKSLESSTFNSYVKIQKDKNIFKSIDQSQLDFIDDFKIEYGIIAKGSEASDLLKSRIVKEIEDSVTGDIFVLFDRDPKKNDQP